MKLETREGIAHFVDDCAGCGAELASPLQIVAQTHELACSSCGWTGYVEPTWLDDAARQEANNQEEMRKAHE